MKDIKKIENIKNKENEKDVTDYKNESKKNKREKVLINSVINKKIKNDKKEILCVSFNADNNYAKYLGISMLSLFEANKSFKGIDVYIMDCGISDENKKKLSKICEEYKRNIFFISMKELISGLKLNMGHKKIAIAAYARLFLSSVIPDTYDKVLYLDCDTIITDNLHKLWETNLTGFLAAGVQDTVERSAVVKIGLSQSDLYVNAGVLLANLAYWRKENIEEQFIDFIDKFKGNVPFHDQGIINGVCNKRLLILPPRYNVTSNMYSFTANTIKRIYSIKNYYLQKDLDDARENPAILHFTTGLVGRPWEENCTHPMKAAFLNALDKSPWKDEPLLPDSRRLSLKAYTFLYRHSPLFISENIYRIGNRFKELVYY